MKRQVSCKAIGRPNFDPLAASNRCGDVLRREKWAPNFSTSRSGVANSMKSESRQRAYEALDHSIKVCRERIVQAKPSPLLQASRGRRVSASVPHGTLADDAARRIAGRALIDELVAHHRRNKGKGLRHFLATFCWDAGRLDPQGPMTFDLAAMRLKVYKKLQALDLSGVCVFEAVALRKTKHNPESLLIHVHAICWTRSRSFKPFATAQKLNSLGTFPNQFGAPSVSFQSRKMAATRFRNKQSARYDQLFAKLEKDQTKASMAWLGYYLFQAPAWVKQLCPKVGRDTGLAMRSNSQNYSPSLAIALDRLLSQIRLTDAVFSVGDGKAVKTPWAQSYRRGLQAVTDQQSRKDRGRGKKNRSRKPSGNSG